MSLFEAGYESPGRWEVFATALGVVGFLGTALRFLAPAEDLGRYRAFGYFDSAAGEFRSVPVTKDALSSIITPPPRAVEVVIVIVAGAVLMVVAKRAFDRFRNPNSQFLHLGQTVAFMAGFVAAASWWAATFATHDANIGGGLGLIMGFPLAGFRC